MTTKIPESVKSNIRDKVACGDYRPVSSDTGPITGGEWLALFEDEAEMQEDNARENHGNDSNVFELYAKELRRLAAELREEGYTPIKFHWEVHISGV